MRPKARRILLYIIITLAILALPLLLPRGCGPVVHSWAYHSNGPLPNDLAQIATQRHARLDKVP